MNLTGWGLRLSVRERRGLILAAVVLVVAGAWRGVWLPLQWRNAAALDQQAEQKALAHQLAGISPAQAGGNPLTAQQLHQTALDAGVQVKRLDVSGNRAHLSVQGTTGTVWPWLEGVDRYRIAFEQLDLTTGGGQLQLTLSLSGLAQPD